MITIDITRLLSQDLKSRSRAQDLLLYVQNCDEQEVVIDFQNVKFATRSFIDEFYNLFIKDTSNLPFKVEIDNVPEDIQIMLNSVSNTQTKSKNRTINATADVIKFDSMDSMLKYMSTVAF